MLRKLHFPLLRSRCLERESHWARAHLGSAIIFVIDLIQPSLIKPMSQLTQEAIPFTSVKDTIAVLTIITFQDEFDEQQPTTGSLQTFPRLGHRPAASTLNTPSALIAQSQFTHRNFETCRESIPCLGFLSSERHFRSSPPRAKTKRKRQGNVKNPSLIDAAIPRNFTGIFRTRNSRPLFGGQFSVRKMLRNSKKQPALSARNNSPA